jgi:hypothetical protein
MSVKIFDTPALQTDVLFNTNNQTNNGRRRQKSTAATRLPSRRSLTPRTPPAVTVIASATGCHAWHPGPVPNCRLFDVECAVSTTPLGAGGGGSSRKPSLTFPAATVIVVESAVSRRLSRQGGGERGGELPSCYRQRQLTREPATLGWST